MKTQTERLPNYTATVPFMWTRNEFVVGAETAASGQETKVRRHETGGQVTKVGGIRKRVSLTPVS